jgi:hypothetical protein
MFEVPARCQARLFGAQGWIAAEKGHSRQFVVWGASEEESFVTNALTKESAVESELVPEEVDMAWRGWVTAEPAEDSLEAR